MRQHPLELLDNRPSVRKTPCCQLKDLRKKTHIRMSWTISPICILRTLYNRQQKQAFTYRKTNENKDSCAEIHQLRLFNILCAGFKYSCRRDELCSRDGGHDEEERLKETAFDEISLTSAGRISKVVQTSLRH